MSTTSWRSLLAVCASLISFVSFAAAPTTFQDTLGVTHEAAANVPAPIFRNPRPGNDLRSWVIHWNEVAINASGVDHTPVPAGDPRVFGEQIGPGRSARAMAIVHIAMVDALIAVNGGYRSYTGLPRVSGPVSTKAAVAYAAHDTLVALFPSQKRAAATRFTGRNLQRCPPRQTSCRCDSRSAQPRRLAARRAGARHRLDHEQRCRPLAPGSGQPQHRRARRALGRSKTVRHAERLAVARRRRRR